MLLHKTPNCTKFCGDRLKNAGDIRYREFVLPEKVGQSSPILGDATPKISHRAKFHRDRSNQLGDRGWLEKNSTHRQTDTHTHGILTG